MDFGKVSKKENDKDVSPIRLEMRPAFLRKTRVFTELWKI